MQPPFVLIILDGFGLRDPKKPGNAITPKTAPTIFRLMKQYASTSLTAHGKAVGLFSGQEGNSEAGHFAIGSGRLIEQDLVRISRAIKDGTLYKNEAFEQVVYHAQKYHRPIHVMGLLTDGQSAHAHPEHVYALLEFLRRKKQKKVFLHLFTDGRDSAPHSAIEHLRALRKHLKNGETIATIMGRFYAMDRNKTWKRTGMAYDTMVRGRGGCTAESAEEAIAAGYNRGETDEFLCPTVITKNGKPIATIDDHDAIFFFNARSDRARQLTKAFVQKDFRKKNSGAFQRKKFPNDIRFAAMTDFGPDLEGVLTAFPSPDIPNCLAKTIGDRYKQLYISETEKFAHVTYFLNGGYAEPINGEDREVVQSKVVYSIADRPEMEVTVITNRILSYLKKKKYNCIVVNFPNADMVGHTGNLAAAKKAITFLDRAIAHLTTSVLHDGGQLLLTADHGNAEVMIDEKTGEMRTEHSTSPVPCILIGKQYRHRHLRRGGSLRDIAPTVLKMLGIPKPKEMTGRALF